MLSLGILLMDLQEVQRSLQHTVWRYAVHVNGLDKQLKLAKSVVVL
jgi:hypothetical protein